MRRTWPAELEVLGPALVITLGRHSMGRFMPGARISQAHGTVRPVDPATGARDALVLAMYHPAAALRTPAIERDSYADMATVPAVLLDARAKRAEHAEQRAAGMIAGAGRRARRGHGAARQPGRAARRPDRRTGYARDSRDPRDPPAPPEPVAVGAPADAADDVDTDQLSLF